MRFDWKAGKKCTVKTRLFTYTFTDQVRMPLARIALDDNSARGVHWLKTNYQEHSLKSNKPRVFFYTNIRKSTSVSEPVEEAYDYLKKHFSGCLTFT